MAIPTGYLPSGNVLLEYVPMNTDYTEHWRQRLIELLQDLKVTQADFAKEVDLTANYVSRLLYAPDKKGRKNLGPSTISKISTKYQLQPGWFELPLGSNLPSSNGNPDSQTESDRLKQGKYSWPFKAVSYDRIDRLRRFYSGEGMPDAISEIDKYLEFLVLKWESEMESNKRTAA